MVRFIAAGIVNTAFSYLLFASLYYLGVEKNLAVLLCYIIGIVFNYKTISVLAFSDRKNKSFIKFVIVYVGSYLLNITALDILVGYGVSPYAAAIVIAFPLAILVYLLNKKYVFKM